MGGRRGGAEGEEEMRHEEEEEEERAAMIGGGGEQQRGQTAPRVREASGGARRNEEAVDPRQASPAGPTLG